MQSIYQFSDPVEIINVYVSELPEGRRRGAYHRLAEAAGIFPSYLSQILKGDRQLNLDQGQFMADHMNLSYQEKRFFLLTVEYGRAQTKALKQFLKTEMDLVRAERNQLSQRVKGDEFKVSSKDLAKFYSSWVYSAVRLLTVLPGMRSAAAIAEHLRMSEPEIKEILDFLVQAGFCVIEKGQFQIGPVHTHLPHQSPFVSSHHSTWRNKAIEHFPFLQAQTELSYTLAVTLSKEDVLKVRQLLLDSIKKVREISDPSPAENLYTLNLDWFEV